MNLQAGGRVGAGVELSMGLLQRLWLDMRLREMCTLGVSVAPESAERPRALSLLATWFLRAVLLALTSPSARHG